MDSHSFLNQPLRLPNWQILQWSYRRIASSFLLLALLVCALWVSGRGLAPPRFVSNSATQSGLSSVDEQAWRKASDWVARRKYAVLTFDDGPYGHGVDQQILDVLQRHHAHAVFFVICNHINDATQPLLGAFERDGHIIGNHSFDHTQLNKLDPTALRQQVEGCSARLADVTGHRPYYFRPPFGANSAQVKKAAAASGMQQMLWNANSEDSWQTRPEQIMYWSRTETSDLSILLMHDKPATAAVLDQVLTELEQRGFEFVLPEQPFTSDMNS